MTQYEDTASVGISINPVMLLPILIISLLYIISLWKLFSKVGKPGWHSIIPFLNMYDLFEISGMAGWLFITTIIPIVGLFIGIMFYLNLAHRFGKGNGFGLFILLFPFIGIPVLAFSKLEYDDTNNYSFHSPKPKKEETEETLTSSKDVMKKLMEDEKHLNENNNDFQGIPSLNDIYNTSFNGNNVENSGYMNSTPEAMGNANITNNNGNNGSTNETSNTTITTSTTDNTITMVDNTKSGKAKESKGLFDSLKKK